jgi:hypothetical protein
MTSAAGNELSLRWGLLQPGQVYRSPSGRKSFKITSITSEKIIIKTEKTEITIKPAAFLAALEYLRMHRHTEENKVKIRSNKDISKAGPLCIAIRNANGVNVMISTYVLPMLAEMKLVGIDSAIPNRVWLTEQ